MIRFNHLSIKNFLSIESLEIDFIPGKHIILGKNLSSNFTDSNGSGKSSMIEAILFALYRDYPRKDICRRGEKYCEVSIDFTVNSKNYIVKRSIDDGRSGLVFIVDGEDASSRGIRNIEKDILSVIGLPYNLFTSSVIIPQGYPVNISQMTPTVRKSLIESLLGLLLWEDYQVIFSSASKEYEANLNAATTLFNEKREMMISLNSKIEGIKDFTNDQLSEIKENILSIKNDIFKLRESRDSIDGSIKSITDKSIESLSSESSVLSQKINILNERKQKLEKSLLDKKCYICNRDYTEDNLKEMQSDLDKTIQKIDKYSEVSSSLKDEILQVQRLLNDKMSVDSEISRNQSELKRLNESYKKYSENDKIDELSLELNNLNDEVNLIKENLDILERDTNSVKFICQSLLPSSKFRTKMVGLHIQVLNQYIEDITSVIIPELSISLESSSNEAGIDVIIKDSNQNSISYYSLSGGEKRRIDIILTMSIQKFLLESSFTDSNILIYDEIFDNLDVTASNQVISAISNFFDEEKSIIVISHNENIKSLFESQIYVEKINNISYYDLTSYQ